MSPVILPEAVKSRVKVTFIPYKTYNVFEKQFAFDQSSSIRIEVWKNTIERLKKSPFFGYGVLGGGGAVDSQYARVLIETGIVGFFLFTWIMVTLFKVGLRAYRSTEGNNIAQGLSLGFIAGFVGLLVQGLTAGNFIIVRIMEPFWFITALVVFLPALIHQKE
jgi:O-antigen ligase